MTKGTRTRSIEIDFEVYQLIVIEKRGFHESDNVALRRLLKLRDDPPEATAELVEPRKPMSRGSWKGRYGVILPPGTELKMECNDHEYHGVIKNGTWHVEGRSYNSPSRAAAGAARVTALNGWIYWQVKRPSDERWIALNSLRATMPKSRKRRSSMS